MPIFDKNNNQIGEIYVNAKTGKSIESSMEDVHNG